MICAMASSDFDNKIEELEYIAIFGFDGTKPNGLKLHQNHLIFPLGSKISIINVENNKQEFLYGHTNTVSAIAISKCGKYVGSGQISQSGNRAYVIVWNWESRQEISRYQLHKDEVLSLCFSSDGEHLISLGGLDDGRLVVWNIERRTAICGALAKNEVTGTAVALCALHKLDNIFITCGEQHLRVWHIDTVSKKLIVLNASLGKIRRNFTSMKVSDDDSIVYVGTMSGDVVKIRLNCRQNEINKPTLIGAYGRHNAKKPFGKDCDKYMNGVRDLIFVNNEQQLLIGAGDGTIELVEERKILIKEYPMPTWPIFKALKRKKVNGCVTSLQLHINQTIYIGTDSCEIYTLDYHTFTLKLQITCNSCMINDIAFPNNFSSVFATASYQSVRVWSLMKKQELLRIVVPNFSASAVIFSYDGQSIITAWNDGVIRSFTPITGKLIYAISNAHNKGCSAITISSCDNLLVSGGNEGQIRIWRIAIDQQNLITVLKEHTAPIASLQFNCFDREIVSSSSDGTCIIWDITRMTRKHVLCANTQFTCAEFFPTGVQVLTTGSDHKISYWEVFDGSLVRYIEGSTKGSINWLSINSSGEMFVSGGTDQIIKLWDYQTAMQKCAGIAHATSIICCRFSPCGKFIVSGSADGAVIIWKVPQKYWPKPDADPLNVSSIEIVKKKLSKYEKRPEDIKHTDSNRSKKDLQICECPPIKANTTKTNKSTSSTSNGKTNKQEKLKI